MASSSLENKTIRPGSLGAYSYYHSARRPDHTPPQTSYIAASGHRLIPRKLVIAVVVVAALVVLPLMRGGSPAKQDAAARAPISTASPSGSVSGPAPASAAGAATVSSDTASTNECAGNTAGKKVLISISKRHMWACEKSRTAYDAPVITGMTAYPATLTPPGTYHIYAKQKDTVLTGTDITGSWNDPVHYWMPFLDNQYGTYGFHDATWRSNDEFGKVSPASKDASHGCVELPLTASAWLYDWAPVGTAVTINK